MRPSLRTEVHPSLHPFRRLTTRKHRYMHPCPYIYLHVGTCSATCSSHVAPVVHPTFQISIELYDRLGRFALCRLLQSISHPLHGRMHRTYISRHDILVLAVAPGATPPSSMPRSLLFSWSKFMWIPLLLTKLSDLVHRLPIEYRRWSGSTWE